VAGDPERSRAWRLEHSWWILTIVLTLGWLSWVGFAYVGARGRKAAWLLSSAGYFVLGTSGFVLLVMSGSDDWEGGVGTVLTLAAWIGGFAHALVIRGEVLERLSVDEDPRLRSARSRRLKREIAEELARRTPELALEAGVGQEADTFGGLIDVNHASAHEIARLPGFNEELAGKVVDVRDRIDGFDSVNDFATILDLPPRLVDTIRDRLVCLPR